MIDADVKHAVNRTVRTIETQVNGDWPESEDPAVSLVGRGEGNEMKEDAAERLE